MKIATTIKEVIDSAKKGIVIIDGPPKQSLFACELSSGSYFVSNLFTRTATRMSKAYFCRMIEERIGAVLLFNDDDDCLNWIEKKAATCGLKSTLRRKVA